MVVFYHSGIIEVSAAVSVFSPRSTADTASVWYAEVLLPLTLCPYVLYYAIGGAILSSAVMGRDKADLSPQTTHDTALRPGFLFMASHVSKGLLPWEALFKACGSRKKKTTLSTVGILIAVMWQHEHMAER